MKSILSIAILAITFSASSYNDGSTKSYGDENGDFGFSTFELVKNDLNNLTSCLEYTIHGISMRVYFKKGVPIFFWTLNVSHNSPDNLYMTHYEIDNIPLREFNVLFGKPYKVVTDLIIQTPVSAITGMPPLNEVAGSKFFHQGYNDYQSHNFYESTVLGNPSGLIFKMFSKSGLKLAEGNDGKPCDTPGCIEDAFLPNNSSPDQIVDGWSKGIFTQTLDISSVVQQISSSVGTIKKILSIINNVNNAIQQISQATGKSLDIGGSLFCPNNASPFKPKYLSGIDANPWRLGYPVADAEYSTEVLNTMSNKRVGGKFKIPPSKINMYQTFGHIFPRDGTVNQPQTAKAAIVIAKRTESLLSNSGSYRIVPGRGGKNSGVWSRQFPSTSSCRNNIAYTGLNEHTQGKHAWTQWPKYRCDLVRRGTRVMFIPIKITITRPVKD